MDWTWFLIVLVSTFIGALAYYFGYRHGAQRILNEWKDWLNESGEDGL